MKRGLRIASGAAPGTGVAATIPEPGPPNALPGLCSAELQRLEQTISTLKRLQAFLFAIETGGLLSATPQDAQARRMHETAVSLLETMDAELVRLIAGLLDAARLRDQL